MYTIAFQGCLSTMDESANIFHLTLFIAAPMYYAGKVYPYPLYNIVFLSLLLYVTFLFYPLCEDLYKPRWRWDVAKSPQFPFLGHGQDVVMFFNGCLTLSASVNYMVSVQYIKIFSDSSQRRQFLFITLLTRPTFHRHVERLIWQNAHRFHYRGKTRFIPPN